MSIDKPSITHDLPTPHVAGFVSAEPFLLAKVYAQTDAEYNKYARLIAAAPDILEALKLAEGYVAFDVNSGDGDRELLYDIRAAIAKATGQ